EAGCRKYSLKRIPSSQHPHLPAGEIRIDARQDEISPILLQLRPKGARVLPCLRIDSLAMPQVVVKNLGALAGEFRVADTDDQFIIDAQAPHVEVGRADIDDVVENEQFCVENLRLIFVNLDA